MEECYVTHHGKVYGHTRELSDGTMYLYIDDAPWGMSEAMAEAVARTFVNKGLKQGLKYLTRTCKECWGCKPHFKKYIDPSM